MRRSGLVSSRLLIFMGAAIVSILLAGAAPSLLLLPLDGGAPRSLTSLTAGLPVVLVFWRADCSPCLVELKTLDRLRRSTRPWRLVLVGLQPAADLNVGLARLGLDPAISWRAADDPARVLVAFGGAPPRLPLSVALFGDGRICASRIGLLGPGLVEDWISRCTRKNSEERP